MDAFLEMPFGLALAALFGIVMVRVNVTYWIGRGAAAGVERTRLSGAMHHSKAIKAQVLIRRWGPYAVVLSFLTIGLQTAVNLAAGAAGMPLRRYLPAATAGSIVWALLYATIGLAAIEGWLAVAAASPAVAVAVVALLAVVLVWLLVARRRRRRRSAAAPADSMP